MLKALGADIGPRGLLPQPRLKNVWDEDTAPEPEAKRLSPAA